MGIAMFAVFLLLLALGVPIIFVLGLTSAIYMIASGTPLIALAQRMFVGMDSFVLMAIPFYILVGNLMSSGDITRQIVKWCRTLVGHIPGGLAHVNVLASVLFAGISGSASADTSAVGGILIPAMVDEGYDVDFSSAVTVASSCLSPIIPPSIVFVVYAVVAEVSIAEMFMAGIVPGCSWSHSRWRSGSVLRASAAIPYRASERRSRSAGRNPSFARSCWDLLSSLWVSSAASTPN